MKRLFIVAALATALLATACGEKKKTDAEMITSHEWLLNEIIYDGQEFTETPPGNVTLIFSDSTNRIAGRGGCNNFFGVYEVKENKEITVDVGGATMMACPHLEFEGKYFELLRTVNKYKVTDDELKLEATREGTTLVYKPVIKAVE